MGGNGEIRWRRVRRKEKWQIETREKKMKEKEMRQNVEREKNIKCGTV